jgi:predicted nuclease of predicted toxin-antitoxin system
MRAGFMIVSKDNDFQQMSFVFGPPPKVIWIRRGNCSVQETERTLRSNSARIQEFEEDQVAAYLILS